MIAGAADLRRLPKLELHVHLEGTVAAPTALLLAGRHGVDPATLGLVDGGYPARYRDLGDFLERYGRIRSLIRAADDIALVASEFARGQAAHNIRYTEASLAATQLVGAGIGPAELWAALRVGLAAGGPGTQIRILVEVDRSRGVADAEAAIRLVEEAGADAPIAGFGLLGRAPANTPAGAFAILRHAADRLALGLSVHAGETGPPAGIWSALDDLGADRIAHGVTAWADPALVARLARDRVPLDQCLSSNVATGAVRSPAAHPYPRLAAAGVIVTISTDDPPFFRATLEGELRLAAGLASLDRAGLAALQRAAATAAFLAPDAAAIRLTEIDTWEAGQPG